MEILLNKDKILLCKLMRQYYIKLIKKYLFTINIIIVANCE